MLIADTHRPIPKACRLLIVGAGLAGLELASQLSTSRPDDVLVLEAGSSRELRHTNMHLPPDKALQVWLEAGRDACFHRSWHSETPPHYQGLSGLRRRIGGRSLYWHGVTLPLESWALRKPWWPSRLISDLETAWQDGASLYARVALQLSDWSADGATTERHRAVRIRRASAEGALAHAASPIKIGRFTFVPTPTAIRREATGSGKWFAYSPLDWWRDPVTGKKRERDPSFVCFSGVEVIRLLLDRGRVCGALVRRDGAPGQMRVSADAVVLAAGTIESTRLAIQALWEVSALSRPRLDKLADHIVQGVAIRLPAAQAKRLLQQIPVGSYFTSCASARSNLFLTLSEQEGHDVLVDLQLTGEQLPSSESFVSCEPSTEFPWPVRIRTAVSPEDRAVIDAQQDILREAWALLADADGCRLAEPRFADYERPLRGNDFLLAGPKVGEQITWSNSLGTEDHEGGTLPFGTIIDDDHQFMDIPGLHVAGPASFPRLGAANPAMTIMALSHRLAARVSRCL